MPAALAFPAPSSTMQKGATDRHPHSRGAASYGHGGPWLHALPPCCKGTQVELEPNRRPEAWLQAMSPTTTTEGGKTRLTRTHWPLGSPSEPHETARALRARLRPPHGPTRPARCRPGLQASGHGPPEADWPKAYLPFYSEPLDDPWLCRHVKLLKNRLVPQTYIESDALGRQMYLQAKNSSTCAHEA